MRRRGDRLVVASSVQAVSRGLACNLSCQTSQARSMVRRHPSWGKRCRSKRKQYRRPSFGQFVSQAMIQSVRQVARVYRRISGSKPRCPSARASFPRLPCLLTHKGLLQASREPSSETKSPGALRRRGSEAWTSPLEDYLGVQTQRDQAFALYDLCQPSSCRPGPTTRRAHMAVRRAEYFMCERKHGGFLSWRCLETTHLRFVLAA